MNENEGRERPYFVRGVGIAHLVVSYTCWLEIKAGRRAG